MVFDGHSDILTDVTIRRLIGETDIIRKHHINRLRKGLVCGACFSLWIDDTSDPPKRLEQILAAAHAEFMECADLVCVIHSHAELKSAIERGSFAVLLGVEGLSGIGADAEALFRLYDFGIRTCMLTWNEANEFASGALCDNTRGLTDLGKKAVGIIREKKMLLDVSHLNERSFWDVVNVSDIPIIASHSNARALCDVRRNLSDSQLLAIRDAGGLVGLNAYHKFVDRRIAYQNIDRLADHAAYIAEKIGAAHIGLGLDFFEFFPAPLKDQSDKGLKGLESCVKLPAFLKKLGERGFTGDELEKISIQNWERLMRQCL